MELKDYSTAMESFIKNKTPNKEIAAYLRRSVRQTCRRKKDFINEGRTEFIRGCHSPYTEKEAVTLFKELAFKLESEKMVKAIERVCEITGKKIKTERRKVSMLSYPSLSYYFIKPTTVVIPIKNNVKFRGGILFGIDEEKNNELVVDYIPEVGNEEEKMVDGRNDENYLKLIDFIIKIMSRTYFVYVKDRTDRFKDKSEKLDFYYRKFKSFIQKDKTEEEELKEVLNIWMTTYISPLTSSFNDDNNDDIGIGSLNNSPRYTSNEDDFDYGLSLSQLLPPLSPSPLPLSPSSSSPLLLTPLQSPLSSPRCRSRSRSPFRMDEYEV